MFTAIITVTKRSNNMMLHNETELEQFIMHDTDTKSVRKVTETTRHYMGKLAWMRFKMTTKKTRMETMKEDRTKSLTMSI